MSSMKARVAFLLLSCQFTLSVVSSDSDYACYCPCDSASSLPSIMRTRPIDYEPEAVICYFISSARHSTSSVVNTSYQPTEKQPINVTLRQTRVKLNKPNILKSAVADL